MYIIEQGYNLSTDGSVIIVYLTSGGSTFLQTGVGILQTNIRLRLVAQSHKFVKKHLMHMLVHHVL